MGEAGDLLLSNTYFLVALEYLFDVNCLFLKTGLSTWNSLGIRGLIYIFIFYYYYFEKINMSCRRSMKINIIKNQTHAKLSWISIKALYSNSDIQLNMIIEYILKYDLTIWTSIDLIVTVGHWWIYTWEKCEWRST